MAETCYHLGLIGYPLGHSLSPQLHRAALAAAGLAGEYCLYPIAPTPQGREEIGCLIDDLRQGRLHGLNVTIPHKQNVLPFVDRQTLVVQAVGALNTLYATTDTDGMQRVTGDNTDVPGFLWDIHRLMGKAVGKALVLGAGGSARAVVYALAVSGWQVSILARRVEQATRLADEIGIASGFQIRLQSGSLDLPTLRRASEECDLLVNTTPLGMTPNMGTCAWPENLAFPKNAAVYDLVYNPLETRLVQRARQAGKLASSGAGMLIAQAALAFQRWTGLEPPFEIMEKAFYGDAL